MMPSTGTVSVDLCDVPHEAIALLRQCGSMQRPHSGRTLFDHLAGTYGLLRSWGNSEPVCLGGLFHSIYGTNAFKHQSLPEVQRGILQSQIGVEAEYLAWRFCNIDRPRAILAAIDHREPTSDWIALAEIEAANLIEQGDIGRSVRDLYCAGMDQSGVLSHGAIAALQEALSKQLQATQPSITPTGAHLTQGAHP